MVETPPTSDQQRATEIRRLFKELIEAVNAAGMAGLDVDLDFRSHELQTLLGRKMPRIYEGHAVVRREVI